MLYFVDVANKRCFIMSLKCGTTTVAHALNANLFEDYTQDYLNNSDYVKYIIIRKSVHARFLSGFYEDLFNNCCYNNMTVNFNDYLMFLFRCFKQKTPTVNNITMNGEDIPVWYGNCSGLSLPITNEHGSFCSHIISQKNSISHITDTITCTNVKLIELSNLSTILPGEKCNVKVKSSTIPDNFFRMPLAEVKSQRIVIDESHLSPHHRFIISKIYDEDVVYMKDLEEKWPYAT